MYKVDTQFLYKEVSNLHMLRVRMNYIQDRLHEARAYLRQASNVHDPQIQSLTKVMNDIEDEIQAFKHMSDVLEQLVQVYDKTEKDNITLNDHNSFNREMLSSPRYYINHVTTETGPLWLLLRSNDSPVGKNPFRDMVVTNNTQFYMNDKVLNDRIMNALKNLVR